MSPSRPLRPCGEPGCPVLVKSGRCPVHQREAQKASDTKSDAARAFYSSYRWQQYRARYIKAHPLCVACKASGVITAAKVVDHITPMEQGGEPWNPANHQGLCGSCHQRKRGQERQSRAR